MNWTNDLKERNLTNVCWCCLFKCRFPEEVTAMTSYIEGLAEGPVYVCRDCRKYYNYPMSSNLPPYPI